MATRTKDNCRDLRVQRTYKLLKEAFMQLLSQKTFEQITVQEICEAAMVRRTTFYQHFEDKYDFLKWFIRETQREFAEQGTDGIPPENLSEYYAQILRNALKYLREKEHFVHLLLDAGVQGKMLMDAFSQASVEDMLMKLEKVPNIQERLGNIPISCLAEFYVGGIFAAARWWFRHGQPCSEEEMVSFIHQMFHMKEDDL